MKTDPGRREPVPGNPAGQKIRADTGRRHRTPRPRDQAHLQDLLDEALDETFPASDPIELSSDED